MRDLYLVTQKDRDTIRNVVNEMLAAPKNTTQRPNPVEPDLPAPDTFIVLAPSGGIPARVGAKPGNAFCTVYRYDDSVDPDNGDLVEITDVEKRVFNLSTAEIPEGTYVLVTRDKYGNYVVTNTDLEESIPGNTAGIGDCVFSSLRTSDCIEVTDGDQVLYLHYIGGGIWSSAETGTGTVSVNGTSPEDGYYTYPLGSGILRAWVENGSMHMSLDGTELLNCGDGCFSGGPITGHASNTSGSPTEACTGEAFTLCASCVCCSIPLWNGPGWYCIDGGGTAPDELVELLEEDRCDTGIVITSGPYATETIGLGFCSFPQPNYNLSCYGYTNLPDRVRVTITGSCPSLTTAPVVLYADTVDSVSGLWSFQADGTPDDWSLIIELLCWPEDTGTGADPTCNGPLTAYGSLICQTLGVAFDCSSLPNQQTTGSLTPTVDVTISLYGGTFILHIEDYGDGPP